MNQARASKEIFKRWLDMWPGLSSGVPYSLDNNLIAEGATLARVSITPLDSEQHTLGRPGRRKWWRPGFIEVRLTGPMNEGRRHLDELAQHVRTIYEGVRFGERVGDDGIVTHATSVANPRQDPDGPQLWVVVCTTPFEFYEVR